MKIDLLTRFADRANPLLIRTIRQDLRSRLFTGTYLLALGIAAVVAVSVCLLSDTINRGAGMALFASATVAWAVGGWAVAGQSAFGALVRERQDDTWDLVELTGMGPGRVVRGIWFAGMVQAAVFGAALAPFLTMGFLLRGVDLGVAMVALIGVPLIAASAIALAVFAATLPQGRATRNGATGLVGIALIGVLCGGLGLILGGGKELTRELGRDHGWFLLIVIASVAFWAVVMPLVLATSQISHRAADRSTWPRLCWLLVPLHLMLLLIIGFVLESMRRSSVDLTDLGEAAAGFGMSIVCWSIPLGIGAIAEPWALTVRQERSITEAPRWRRWLTPLVGPGAARGRLAFLAVLGAGVGLSLLGLSLWANSKTSSTGVQVLNQVTCLIAAYTTIFLVLGDVISRQVLPNRWRTPQAQRLMTVATILVWSALATIPLAMFDGIRNGGVAYLSPILGLIQAGDGYGWRDRTVAWTDPGYGIVILGGVICLMILLVQGLRLRIQRAEVLARSDDRNPRG